MIILSAKLTFFQFELLLIIDGIIYENKSGAEL